MIDSADDALVNWLGAELSDPVDVGTPPENAKKATLWLHLHDLRERTDERTDDHDDIRDDDGRVIARQGGPRMFELSYLAIATGPAREQHRLLGTFVQAIVDHAHIPSEHVPEPIRLAERPVLLELLQPEQLVDLTAAAGSPGHAAVGLQVVVPVRPAPEREIAEPAAELELDARQRFSGRASAHGGSVDDLPSDVVKRWTAVRVRESVVDDDTVR
jgi:hypothetical protein